MNNNCMDRRIGKPIGNDTANAKEIPACGAFSGVQTAQRVVSASDQAVCITEKYKFVRYSVGVSGSS